MYYVYNYLKNGNKYANILMVLHGKYLKKYLGIV